MKSDVNKRNVDARDELLARILDGAVGKKENQQQRQTGDLCTRVAKSTKVDSGTFEHLL